MIVALSILAAILLVVASAYLLQQVYLWSEGAIRERRRGGLSEREDGTPDPGRHETGDVAMCDIKPCPLCRRPVAGRQAPDAPPVLNLYRLKVDSLILNPRGIQEHVGLSMFFGGHEGLAMAMGGISPAAKRISTLELVVCLECATTRTVMEILEVARHREEAEARAQETPA